MVEDIIKDITSRLSDSDFSVEEDEQCVGVRYFIINQDRETISSINYIPPDRVVLNVRESDNNINYGEEIFSYLKDINCKIEIKVPFSSEFKNF